MRRRLPVILPVLVGLAALGWFALRVRDDGRIAEALRLARIDLEAGRPGLARDRLAPIAASRPDRADLAYWLGVSAWEAGDQAAGAEALRRIPDADPLARDAALTLGRLELEAGRLRPAEEALDRAAKGGGPVADQAWDALGRLYALAGRPRDQRRLLLRQAGRTNDPSDSLRALWALDGVAYPVDGVRRALEDAHARNPDDDRTWLALADLELRAGALDAADRWLSKCEAATPDDTLVARSRLLWSKAADRPEVAVKAARLVPADALSPGERDALRAWLDARAGDREAERATLEGWLEREPGALVPLERLAGLEAESGRVEPAAELRRRKAAVEAARERRRALLSQPDPASRAAEIARASEAAGALEEAALWWRLAARKAADATARDEAEAKARALSEKPAAPAPIGLVSDWLGPLADRFASSEGETPAGSVPTYVDDAEARGLRFTFDNGRSEARQLPETMSGGLAVFDYDGDGRLDVYAVQGGTFPPPPSAPFGDRLFRNRGDGTFEDATEAAGLAKLPGGYGHGVAVGDFDGDGHADVFVTRWRRYALYRNRGDGTFEDATEAVGLGGDRDWPTSAAFADLDGDGDLDLYVCHYLRWDEANPQFCPDASGKGASYCDPRLFPAIGDRLYRNDGGRFIDATEEAGIVDPDGRGLGVVAADLDDDGLVDLFVANDTTSNLFFRNQGGLKFAEQAMEAGLAASAGGGFLAGMGIACGDLDGDGLLDLAVTNFYGESTTLYHNHGGGLFSDRSAAAGLASATRYVLGFGLAALDADCDGLLDLAQANGHVNDYSPATRYAMPAQLFLGDVRGRLRDVSAQAGPPWSVPRVGRGLAIGDLDDDGRPEILMVADGESLACFHQASSPGRSVGLQLVGTKSNRDAVGAKVTLLAGGRRQVAVRFGGGSYQSAVSPRLHFGLGAAPRIDRIEVAWPSGRLDTFEDLDPDRVYRLVEGESRPEPLPGKGP
ncbi:FG-GAP-like repeat-containing protein [Planctomyces sp. SH-PL62]|uniref:FG-GAP-like repeat-containing protein n=1 Tax=Planctomyces sp. SH-PL62 TaxID=1636152 RepID=UPI00078C5FB1|nr:FG-GAP-like repeat-containing protein [Planctomyces sp. SH-PL62]AMV38154.1 FG-GAP repeat protein [Planctomyces sp. SH-PL62]